MYHGVSCHFLSSTFVNLRRLSCASRAFLMRFTVTGRDVDLRHTVHGARRAALRTGAAGEGEQVEKLHGARAQPSATDHRHSQRTAERA